MWVVGHSGMAGSALVRRLAEEDCELVTVHREEIDPRHRQTVQVWKQATRSQAVLVAAATVGEILANHSRPA